MERHREIKIPQLYRSGEEMKIEILKPWSFIKEPETPSNDDWMIIEKAVND